MEKVEPVYSSGFSFFSRARPASSRTSAGDLAHALAVGVADHGRDQPLVHRHRHADVHAVVEADGLAGPRGVHPRVLAQRGRHGLDDQVVGATLTPWSLKRSLMRPRSFASPRPCPPRW